MAPVNVMAAIITCWSTMLLASGAEGFIGINWGRQTSHRLIPSMVVDLLLQNNVSHLKLFSPSDNVLKAFASSGISIALTLPNESLREIRFPIVASYWLQQRVLKYLNQDIQIRYVQVGSEPFSTYAREKVYDEAPVALRLIQQALIGNGYHNVTAIVPHFTDVLTSNISKPSEADFQPSLKEHMVEIIHLLNSTGAPFVFNMFPIYSITNLNINDTEFAFIDNKSNFTIEDNGLIYRNVFEFIYDSFLHALAKAGSPDMEVMVGTIGWPTDGYTSANVVNAERFHREFLPYIKSNKGTPLRPGISIDVFINSLADENQNNCSIAPFQRHWGIYFTNGQPKYKIDFTGQGRDIFPTTAKGLIPMPQRWCVYNNQASDSDKVKMQISQACQLADCTALYPGGSCSHLNFIQNVSYSFNMAFQTKSQEDTQGAKCDFDGLGMLVSNDPSDGTCKFPIEILAAEKEDTDGLTSGHGKACSCGFLTWVVLSLIFDFMHAAGIGLV